MTKAICSKMWTDVDIRMPANRIANCCKSWQWENYTPEQIREMGASFFNARPELVKDKSIMLKKNKLPPNCGECAAQFPGGYFGGNNVWLNRDWTKKDIKHIKRNDLTSHIEIMLSTTCNMSCMYCNENVSSTWAEIKGTEKTTGDKQWKDAVFENLYRYIPTLDRQMFFNFTGGEPLLDWDIFDIIERIVRLADKRFRHQIMITSNLNIKPKLLERFFQVVDCSPNVEWRMTISIDEVGKSHLRDGLLWDRFEQNINAVANNKNIELVNFLPAITNLSIPGHTKLVKYLQKIKTKGRFQIGNNMVYGPQSLSLTIAPQHFKDYLKEAADAVKDKNHSRFLTSCIDSIGIERTPENINRAKEFFNEQSKWKNVDYFKIYPHLEKILDISIK